MATDSHPGVHIEEIPAARAIQGVPTSVAAFVGTTETGPTAQPTLITSWDQFVGEFGRPGWFSYTPWAVYEFFNEGGSACYVVRVDASDAGKAAASIGGTTLTAATPGAWGNELKVHVANSAGDSATTSPGFDVSVVVDAAVIDGAQGKPADVASADLPTQLMISFVRQNGIPRTLGGKYYVLESFTGLTEVSLAGGPAGPFAQKINSTSLFIRAGASDGKRPPNTSAPTAFSGGSNPKIDLVDAIKTLATVQGVSLLAVPETVILTNSSGKTDAALQSETINQGLNFCETLQSVFYVTDPPFGMDVQTIQEFVAGGGGALGGGGGAGGGGAQGQSLNSSYGAIYYPWVWILDPVASRNLPIPPSGPVLGRYAQTDTTIGVFKSAAGVSAGAMQSVVGVLTPVHDSDQDQLNPRGINAIRNLVNYGNVIWGARTLSKDTDWTYVSVRRLIIYVEQSLERGLQWVVFEPNDQRLWAAINRDVSAFLTVLWRQGGLFGATPAQAFFVTCDATNKPPETRALGDVYIDIGLAAVHPAEFVVIRITQKTAGPGAGP